jgi:hypothetical protein
MVICYKCGKVLSSLQNLNYHLSKKVPCDSDDLKCPSCVKVFPSKTKLYMHLKLCEKLHQNKHMSPHRFLLKCSPKNINNYIC